jgi:hypothetical protein
MDQRPTHKEKRNATDNTERFEFFYTTFHASQDSLRRAYTYPLSRHQPLPSPPAAITATTILDPLEEFSSHMQHLPSGRCRHMAFENLVIFIPPVHVPAWSSRYRADSSSALFLSPMSLRSEA